MTAFRHRARWAALTTGFAAALLLTTAGLLAALDRAQLEYRQVDLDILDILGARLSRLAAERGHERLLLFLGDSLAENLAQPKSTAPRRLAELLEHQIQVKPLTSHGLSIYSHYFMSDRMLAIDPDHIVLQVNLASFSPYWNAVERTQLVAWLPARRWLEALQLPLHVVGISADRMIFNRAIVKAGGFEVWHRLQREQVRALRAYWKLADWAQAKTGQPKGLAYRKLKRLLWLVARVRGNRPTAYWVRSRLGPALDGLPADHPVLHVLDALLAHFQEAGVSVVMYAAPFNVEHLRAQGTYNEEGIAHTSAQIDALARRRGAVFLDLHALLPDAAFSDHTNHLYGRGEIDGPGLLAKRIAAAVLAASTADDGEVLVAPLGTGR